MTINEYRPGFKPGYLSEQEKKDTLLKWTENRLDMKMYQLEEAFGTNDFTSAVYDCANSSAMKGYGQVDPVWKYCSTVVTRNDFKDNYLKVANGMGLLQKRLEQEPMTLQKPTDRKETYAIFPYDAGFALSLEAWANDELGILQEKFRSFGMAAANTLNDYVWGTSGLLGGTGPAATMSDTNELFDASNHANYNASASTLTYATLETAMAAMRNQTDEGGTQKLGVVPKFLFVDPTMYSAAVQLTESERLIATGIGSTRVVEGDKNAWKGSLQVVVVDSLPAGEFVLTADPNTHPVVEMGFYQGKTEPTIMVQGPDSDTEFYTRARTVKCQLIFGGFPASWKTVYKGT